MDMLLATTGSAGDVYPFVTLGRALAARGHRTTLLAPPEFEGLVRRLGLEFVALEGDDSHTSQTVARLLLHKLFRSALPPFSRRWCKLARASTVVPLLRPLYEAIAGRYIPGRTIVVASSLLLGARVAHDQLKVPLVTVHLSPVALRSAYRAPVQPPLRLPAWLPPWAKRMSYRLLDTLVLDPFLAGPVNHYRAELGLPAIHRVLHNWRHSPQLVLGLFPSWFARPEPDWPTATRLTGFLFDEAIHATGVAPEVDAFLRAGPPPIVFTPGSAINSAHRFFHESVRACVHLGSRGLLLTPHRGQVPAVLPEGVRHFAYAPFNRILVHARALVHTGGIGTAAQALAAGIPQLLMPLKNDQPENTARLVELGVARSFAPRSYCAETVARALADLHTSPAVAWRCRSFATQLRHANPVPETCRLIEQLARSPLARAA